MRLNRFQTLLDARGPDMACWPAAERAAAERLLAESEAARRALAEAEALDRALAAHHEAPAGPLLRAAILDIPDLHARPFETGGVGGIAARRAGAGWPKLAPGWVAIAASAAIGFAVGLSWPSEPPAWQSEDMIALVYGGAGIDEVLQ